MLLMAWQIPKDLEKGMCPRMVGDHRVLMLWTCAEPELGRTAGC